MFALHQPNSPVLSVTVRNPGLLYNERFQDVPERTTKRAASLADLPGHTSPATEAAQSSVLPVVRESIGAKRKRYDVSVSCMRSE